ncbi:MAG TPA: hypothetical protein VJQ83_01445 [Tepidiformaceae bacterium]|nr:hypothetical protein [Tepidiformaceae bacterium]
MSVSHQPIVRLAAAGAVAIAALIAVAEHMLVAPALALSAPFVVFGTLIGTSPEYSRSGRVVAWVGLFVIVIVLVSYIWLIPTSFDASTGSALAR